MRKIWNIEIVCFDHPKIFSPLKKYEYTHIKQAQYKIGKAALEQIINQIENNDDIK